MSKPIGDHTEYCHRCDAKTVWEPLYPGARRVRCVRCQDVYPCRHGCEHLDCLAEKAEWNKERKAS